MDREWGSKPGSGGAATAQNEAIDRRERLRRLALETIDLAKDPYFMRNHLGRYEYFDVSCVSNLWDSVVKLAANYVAVHV